MKIRRIIRNLVFVFIGLFLLSGSLLWPIDEIQRIRIFTSNYEFNYVNWTIHALVEKSAQGAFNPVRYMSDDEQKSVVKQYLTLLQTIQKNNFEIEKIFADPEIDNPKDAAQQLLSKQNDLNDFRGKLEPLAESILQKQISESLSELQLTAGGQPIPPLLYRVTPLPLALIVSPRNNIREIADISLLPDLTLDQITDLENQIEGQLNVSALVVPVGGIGLYPTMVMSTTNFNFLVEVISHEWTHNFLTIRPLGLNYETSPEMRTINETTANLSGKEIQKQVLSQFYPEYLPPEPIPQSNQPATNPSQPEEEIEPVFNYRAEMHITRVNADKLLSEGKIDQAEAYMEQRRQVFIENGYNIRKLNQAYFAFYGAYADEAGGAAGNDPVGPTVTALREKSDSLADFLNQISWVTSFEQLQLLVNQTDLEK